MADIVTVTLHDAEIQSLKGEEWFRAEVETLGQRVAAIARSTAPRRTGAGADSIYGEAVRGPDGWEVRVSWDAAHGYMAAQHSHAIQDAARQIAGG